MTLSNKSTEPSQEKKAAEVKEKKKRNEDAQKAKDTTQQAIENQARIHKDAVADAKMKQEKDEKDKFKEYQKNAVRPKIETIHIDNKSVTDIIIAIAEHAIAEHHKANKNKTSLAFEGTDENKIKRFNIIAEFAKKQLEMNPELTRDKLIEEPKKQEELEQKTEKKKMKN